MGLMSAWTKWQSARAAEGELARLGTEDLRSLARDAGVSADQLVRLASRRAKGADELPLLMKALGLSPEKTARTRPDVMRDMSVVCSGCKVASHCRRAIESGWAPVVQRYCPNAVTLQALLDER
ncbi:hypothetical protein [Microvirga sp. 17 mud 1-3]|uniref:hypothetical protein n=1 Tax=Microvirga sp. 17 mud 1-3 TaxID=2082949 RepID=UPI000D6D5680|nr:hypothetical protein [Microvirga sp. 17 mud 1-3]AWM85409.1 hypothetical protein C4E04_00685 [Microvirga sp. 17 mud 1-3]